MGDRHWCRALRQQADYQQASAMLKAIEEHQQAIARLESSLAHLGGIVDLARVDRLAAQLPEEERLSKQATKQSGQ